jgi:hypothetical protein
MTLRFRTTQWQRRNSRRPATETAYMSANNQKWAWMACMINKRPAHGDAGNRQLGFDEVLLSQYVG